MGPTISVIIPNLNGFTMLKACLKSLSVSLYDKSEILVVDNASSDRSAVRVKREFPFVKVISLDKNRGFSAAANAGIRKASGEYIFLLNNDTVVAPGCISQIARYITCVSRKNVGSFQVAMVDYREVEKADSLGISFDLSFTGYQVGKGEIFFQGDCPIQEVWGVCAGAGVYKKEMLKDLCVDGDYFDEDFFAFYEDVDLSARARLRGWESRLIKNTFVRHVGGGTPLSGYRKNFLLTRNRLFLIVKNAPLTALRTLVFEGRLVEISKMKHFFLNKEYSSLFGFFCGHFAAVPLLLKMIKKRRAILSTRKVQRKEIPLWFA
ncbi:MAG: glycosyltransferase family 2 protein [Nitrospinota bacterium]